MTYQEIFDAVKNELLKRDASVIKDHLAIQVDIQGEGSGTFYIEIKDGKADIQPYDYRDHDCCFLVTGQDFIDICTGRADAVKMFTIGKLKIKGSIDKALEFSKLQPSKEEKKAVRAEAKTEAKAAKAAKTAEKKKK